MLLFKLDPAWLHQAKFANKTKLKYKTFYFDNNKSIKSVITLDHANRK